MILVRFKSRELKLFNCSQEQLEKHPRKNEISEYVEASLEDMLETLAKALGMEN
jgi:hypothetical protein